jgi:hypothetical protein
MIDQMRSQEGDYGVLRQGELPPPHYVNEYWHRVRRALREVFQYSNEDDVEVLRTEVEKASMDTQTIFYHADPFEVAADLARRRGMLITPGEEAKYLDADEREDHPKANLGTTPSGP